MVAVSLFRFAASIAILLSVKVTSGAPAPAEQLHPHSAPSLALRSAHPDRYWFSEHPDQPDNETTWAFSNDRGKSPGYWFRFDGETQFPANGEHMSLTRRSDERYGQVGPRQQERRDTPAWINGYADGYCTWNQFREQVTAPRSGVCYGIWMLNVNIFSIATSGFTTQTNLYDDAGCNTFRSAAWDWTGCISSNGNTPRIMSIWVYG